MSGTWIRPLAALAFIIAVTIPWDFQDHSHWNKVAWLPFVTGIVRPYDLLLNAALYLPLGYLVPARFRRRGLVAIGGTAFVISGLLELTQVWSHVRFPSATDSVMNVVGSVAGAALANWRADAVRPAGRAISD